MSLIPVWRMVVDCRDYGAQSSHPKGETAGVIPTNSCQPVIEGCSCIASLLYSFRLYMGSASFSSWTKSPGKMLQAFTAGSWACVHCGQGTNGSYYTEVPLSLMHWGRLWEFKDVCDHFFVSGALIPWTENGNRVWPWLELVYTL